MASPVRPTDAHRLGVFFAPNAAAIDLLLDANIHHDHFNQVVISLNSRCRTTDKQIREGLCFVKPTKITKKYPDRIRI